MLNPVICPQCFQPNEPARTLCWKCVRSLAVPPGAQDYMRFLSLRRTWNMEDLKTAFRRQAKKYHPDMNPGNREADSYFKFVNQAYEALSRIGGVTAPTAPAEEWEGSEELQQKLRAVIRASRAKEAPPSKPKGGSAFKKLAQWFRGRGT